MKRACKKTQKKLIAYLNLQLEEAQTKEIGKHLASCSLCKQEAEKLRATWDLLGSYTLDRDFPDITPALLEKIEAPGEKYNVFQYVMGALLQIPAPAFCLLIAMLAIPPGAFLGKNLYSSFSGYTDSYLGETYRDQSEEIPFDIFSDLPEQSLGNIFMNILPESFEEE
jgi:hypothetical protein